MEGNGRGEEKVKGKEGERWREGFGPPKNFGVAPPMDRKFAPIHVIKTARFDWSAVFESFW